MRRLLEEFQASERHVCELMEVARSSCRYRSRRDDRQLREQLQALAREHPRFGYRRLHVLLGREQVIVNHKKVQRVYRELGLMVKRNRRKRLQRELRPRPVWVCASRQVTSSVFSVAACLLPSGRTCSSCAPLRQTTTRA